MHPDEYKTTAATMPEPHVPSPGDVRSEIAQRRKDAVVVLERRLKQKEILDAEMASLRETIDLFGQLLGEEDEPMRYIPSPDEVKGYTG